jgi:hypothetical protein
VLRRSPRLASLSRRSANCSVMYRLCPRRCRSITCTLLLSAPQRLCRWRRFQPRWGTLRSASSSDTSRFATCALVLVVDPVHTGSAASRRRRSYYIKCWLRMSLRAPAAHETPSRPTSQPHPQGSGTQKLSDWVLAAAVPVHMHISMNACVTDYVPTRFRGALPAPAKGVWPWPGEGEGSARARCRARGVEASADAC